MTEDLLQYDKLVERALKNVVREALQYVSVHGLPGFLHSLNTISTLPSGPTTRASISPKRSARNIPSR